MPRKEFTQDFKARSNQIWSGVKDAAFAVMNTLGVGFLEKVYENALVHELRKRGFKVIPQHTLEVCYDGVVVGTYVVDLLVEDCILVELKTVKAIDPVIEAICINYIKASPFWLIGLLNFGKSRMDTPSFVDG
jgi:GxxExxY protein